MAFLGAIVELGPGSGTTVDNESVGHNGFYSGCINAQYIRVLRGRNVHAAQYTGRCINITWKLYQSLQTAAVSSSAGT
jgi:hypothetical protein